MRELFTEITINASSDRVWEVLTDFDSYPEWNPFVKRIRGSIQVGNRLGSKMYASNLKPMSFKPRVIKVVPRREFRWLGSLGVPGLFDGEHIFELHPSEPKKVHFIQREVFKGLLVPMIMKNIREDTRAGFEQMNQALKQRCES